MNLVLITAELHCVNKEKGSSQHDTHVSISDIMTMVFKNWISEVKFISISTIE